MEYKITDSIYTEELNQLICIDYISFGFAHFSIALKQPRMSEYLFRKRKIQRHQEDRPVNGMETNDIFSDQVKICRPIFVEFIAAVSVAVIADTCDIVCQSIQPYIYNVLRIEIYRDSPFKGCSGYTEILKSRKKEVVHHLVFTRLRLDEIRMCVDVVNKLICIFTHFEEICLFLGRYAWTSAVRTFAVYKLGLCEEGLTWCTVHSFIMTLVDISLCIHFFEDFFDLLFMVFICCTDEFIIGCVHQIPDAFDLTGNVIYEFLWCNTSFLSLQLDLLAMLISTCLKIYVITLLSFKTCDRIRKNDLIGISDMRFTGCVRNGSADIISLLFHLFFPP